MRRVTLKAGRLQSMEIRKTLLAVINFMIRMLIISVRGTNNLRISEILTTFFNEKVCRGAK